MELQDIQKFLLRDVKKTYISEHFWQTKIVPYHSGYHLHVSPRSKELVYDLTHMAIRGVQKDLPAWKETRRQTHLFLAQHKNVMRVMTQNILYNFKDLPRETEPLRAGHFMYSRADQKEWHPPNQLKLF